MGLDPVEHKDRNEDILVRVGFFWHFSGRSKLAAQLILLHLMKDLPQKVSWVSAYTFYMY